MNRIPIKKISENTDLLYFSRGRGRGHAVPDLAIVRELRRAHPGIRVEFASYGAGIEILTMAEEETADLDLPETASFVDVQVGAGVLLRRIRPALVVSHEEAAVLPIAKAFGLSTMFITHWFTNPNDISMEALRYADEVLFIEREGLFREPENIKGRVRYVGPVLRHFHHLPADRNRVRADLGIAPDESVILILPGREWSRAAAVPDELVLKAFDLVGRQRKRLLWVAEKGPERIPNSIAPCSAISVVGVHQYPERLMVASDVVVTKGTYCTSKELEALGVPSISVSDGGNPIDEFYLSGFRNNIHLWRQDLDPVRLARSIEIALDRGSFNPLFDELHGRGAASAARSISAAIGRVVNAPSAPKATQDDSYPKTSKQRGVYFLANDRVIELTVAFLNSFRRHNPYLELCLIPFDDQTSQIQDLKSRYDFRVFRNDMILARCDDLSQRLCGHSVGQFRKLAMWEGDFEEFAYIDVDTVVLTDVSFGFQFLDRYDFIASNSNTPSIRKGTWRDTVHGALTSDQIAYSAGTGFLLSRRGTISLDAAETALQQAVALSPHIELSLCWDQPFLNLLIVNSNKPYTSLQVISREEGRSDIPLEKWAGTWRGWPYDGRLPRESSEAPPLLIHWAGEWRTGAAQENDLLWIYYHDLHESTSDRMQTEGDDSKF